MNRVATIMLLATTAASASADLVQLETFNNATVQPGGPRTGGSGLAFFNIEGSDYGDFSSYGVMQFDFSGIAATYDAEFGVGNWSVENDASFSLSQSNAFFTADGRVAFYSTMNNSNPFDTEPIYTPNGNSPFSNDYTDATFMTTYDFVEIADGHEDIVSFGISDFADIITSGGVATFLIAEYDDAGVAATWAGFENSDFAGPTLSVEVVPAPGVLAVLGIAGLAGRRRRA